MISLKVLTLLRSLLENLVAGQLRRSRREGMDPVVEACNVQNFQLFYIIPSNGIFILLINFLFICMYV